MRDISKKKLAFFIAMIAGHKTRNPEEQTCRVYIDGYFQCLKDCGEIPNDTNYNKFIDKCKGLWNTESLEIASKYLYEAIDALDKPNASQKEMQDD